MPQRVVRVGDPADGGVDTEQPEHLVDQAVDAEHLPPQHRDRDRGAQHRRQVEDRAVEGQPLHALVQQDGDGQGHDQLQRDADDHVGERDLQRLVQPGVVEHPEVVLQTDPLRRLDQAVLGERQVQRGEHRADGDHHQPDQPRQQEQVARLVVPARLLPAARFSSGVLALSTLMWESSEMALMSSALSGSTSISSTNFCAASAGLGAAEQHIGLVARNSVVELAAAGRRGDRGVGQLGLDVLDVLRRPPAALVAAWA